MVTPLAVIRMGWSQVGHPRSGTYDALNGDHPWAYWCLSFAESTGRNLGLSIYPMPNAVKSGRSQDLQSGPPPLGASVYFDESFYWPDGHVGLSLGNGQLLGTMTDGTGVGTTWWNETTPGFMGWAYMDGVQSGARPPFSPGTDPAPPSTLLIPDNPYGDDIIIGHGFLRMWYQIDIGGDPYTVLGYPMENESTATLLEPDGTTHKRTIQRFERGILQYDPANSFPWDVTVVPRTTTVT